LQTYARNGLVYTIERANGAMVGAKPYLDNVNWTKGIGTYSGLADPTSVAVGWDLIPPQRRGLLCSRRERPRHRADCSLSADRRHEILSSHSLIPPIEILSRAGDEALEKFNEDSGIDTALLLDHEPHLASRGDRRNEAHAMACADGFDDRRFALLAPTPPRVVIRAHVGGIAPSIRAC
jgi:hypothetical protein